MSALSDTTAKLNLPNIGQTLVSLVWFNLVFEK